MYPRRILAVLSVLVLAAAFSAAASASTPKGVTLGVPKVVAFNYDHCWDNQGVPLPCVTVDPMVSNNTSKDIYCTVTVDELNDFIVFDSVVPAGQWRSSEFTAYAPGVRAFTLNLVCGGKTVHGERSRIRVAGA